MSACVKKLKIYERDGSSSSTLRGRGNSRSQKRKIPVDNAIRGWHLTVARAFTATMANSKAS